MYTILFTTTVRYLAILFLLALMAAPASLRAAQEDVSMLPQALKKVRPATWGVAIFRVLPDGRPSQAEFVGTGFFVSDRYFVTAEHVINPEPPKAARGPLDQIRIYQFTLEDAGTVFKGPIEVAHADKQKDLAILKAPFSSSNAVTLSFDPVQDGEPVALYGFPEAGGTQDGVQAFARVIAGIISMQTKVGAMEIIETAISSHPGNSGGPLFLARSGRVIGVHKGKPLIRDTDHVLTGYSLNLSIRGLKEILTKLGVVKAGK